MKFSNLPIQARTFEQIDNGTPARSFSASQIVDHRTMLALVKCPQLVVENRTQWLGKTMNARNAKSNCALTELRRTNGNAAAASSGWMAG